MKLTAETITEEQIRSFESDVMAYGSSNAEKRDAVDLTTWALIDHNMDCAVCRFTRRK